MPTYTFAERCAQAEAAALNAAYPFQPSPVQGWAPARPVLDELHAMEPTEAEAWVKATYRVTGYMPGVVRAYKAQRTATYSIVN